MLGIETLGALPTDVLGVNYYTRAIVRSEDIAEDSNRPRLVPEPSDELTTDMGWEVFPEGLHETLLRLHRDYGAGDLLVTENGAAYADGPGEDGAIHDARRIDYHRTHLEQCQRAIADGVALRGYFAWSLLDNFEWGEGYRSRFGIVHVAQHVLHELRAGEPQARAQQQQGGHPEHGPALGDQVAAQEPPVGRPSKGSGVDFWELWTCNHFPANGIERTAGSVE